MWSAWYCCQESRSKSREKGLKSRDSEDIAHVRRICRSPFLMLADSSSRTGKSVCVTRELLFARGVTRQLLFLGFRRVSNKGTIVSSSANNS